ncbi:type VII secretion protein EccE [Dactylosporangium sp. NPDC000521]|uniref:type VII secretion protein EccE n=1 Tax=Dactylosporangium sp. NPDC000521 TaxID=3363975 RepID=UPI0036A423EC
MYVVLAQAALGLSVLAWTVHPAWALGFVVAPVGLLGRLRGTGPLSAVRPFMTSVDIDGVSAGVVEDADGLAVMIQVGDLSDLLGDAPPPLPPLSTLLPPPTPDLPETRVQLLISATAALNRDASPSAVSYRQLTDGQVLAHQRVLLCVRARRAGGYQREDLEHTLVAAVRRACRQLAKARLPAHPLTSQSASAALAEAAGQRPGVPIRETRRGLEIGGLHQAVFRLRRHPSEGRFATHLLTLPCAAVTVALTAAGDDPCHAELTIRLAAPTPAALDQATAALHRLATAHGAAVTRLRGAQLDGLAATLPLGGGATSPAAALAGLLTGRDDLTPDGTPARPVTTADLAYLQPAPAPSGLMLGRDRHGAPAVIHPFRSEPTRAVLIGGARCAQLLTLRVLAVGAHVTVQSSRPDTWSPFLRSLTGEQITLLPAGQPAALPAPTPTHPQLLVLDAAPNARSAPPARSAPAAQPTSAAQPTPADRSASATRPAAGAWPAPAARSTRAGRPASAAQPTSAARPTPAAQPTPAAWSAPAARAASDSTATAGFRAAAPAHASGPTPASAPAPTPSTGFTSTSTSTGGPDADLVAGAGFPAVSTESPWRATLVIRDELTLADADLLTEADLVFLQPLTPAEATVATDVLGLTASASWLTRIPPEMLGTVIDHHTLRWTHLSPTPIELQLTGGPTR